MTSTRHVRPLRPPGPMSERQSPRLPRRAGRLPQGRWTHRDDRFHVKPTCQHRLQGVALIGGLPTRAPALHWSHEDPLPHPQPMYRRLKRFAAPQPRAQPDRPRCSQPRGSTNHGPSHCPSTPRRCCLARTAGGRHQPSRSAQRVVLRCRNEWQEHRPLRRTVIPLIRQLPGHRPQYRRVHYVARSTTAGLRCQRRRPSTQGRRLADLRLARMPTSGRPAQGPAQRQPLRLASARTSIRPGSAQTRR